MLEEVKNVENSVKKILEVDEEAREDDMQLILSYLNRYHFLEKRLGDKYHELVRIIKQAPSFESIRRTRQKIQERGFYRGKNYEARRREAILMRDYFKKQKGLF